MPMLLERAVVLVEASRPNVAARLQDVIPRPVLMASEWNQDDTGPLVYVGDPRTAMIPMQNIAWLHSSFAGVDSLAGNSLTDTLIITRTIGQMPERIAEYVLAWMLADCQHVRRALRQQANHEWHRLTPQMLTGSKMVLFGVGRMGSRVAMRAAANGVLVHGVTTSPRPISGCATVTDVREGLAACKDANWVVSTLPLTVKTANFFGRSFFDLCHQAHFINVGRGKTCDMDELIKALGTSRLRAATVDVFPEEPLPTSHPAWAIPNLVITSHQAGITTDDDVINDFTECWAELAGGRTPRLNVNLSRGY